MQSRSPELVADLQARLRRIEGQVRGVQRMIEEERDCPEILQQMTAVRAAMRQASLALTREYVASALREQGLEEYESLLDRLMSTLGRND